MSRRKEGLRRSGPHRQSIIHIVCTHEGKRNVVDRIGVVHQNWLRYLKGLPLGDAVTVNGETRPLYNYSRFAELHRSVDLLAEQIPTGPGDVVQECKFRAVCDPCPNSKGRATDVTLSWENFDRCLAFAILNRDTRIELSEMPLIAARVQSNSPNG